MSWMQSGMFIGDRRMRLYIYEHLSKKALQIFTTCQSQPVQTVFNFNSDMDFHRNHLH